MSYTAKNWWELHYKDCGTKYRGCSPLCSKAFLEEVDQAYCLVREIGINGRAEAVVSFDLSSRKLNVKLTRHGRTAVFNRVGESYFLNLWRHDLEEDTRIYDSLDETFKASKEHLSL